MSQDNIDIKDSEAEHNEEEVVLTDAVIEDDDSTTLDEDVTEPVEKKEEINIVKEIISWVLLIAGAFLIAYIVTQYIIVKAVVPTGSMEETIMTGDQIVGNRLAYLFSEPERGDIVIFYFPDDPQQKEKYIKRIIGLPGDRVKGVDGVVYINDVPLDEPYLKEAMIGSFSEVLVPENSYFMLGDNRNGSIDARYWDNQFVTIDKIIAKACFRYLPSISKIE